MEHGLPLIWFWGVAPATYEAIWPVWLIGEEPDACQFVVAVDAGQRSVTWARAR
jgi:putative restriction endonuclease